MDSKVQPDDEGKVLGYIYDVGLFFARAYGFIIRSLNASSPCANTGSAAMSYPMQG